MTKYDLRVFPLVALIERCVANINEILTPQQIFLNISYNFLLRNWVKMPLQDFEIIILNQK